MFLIFGWKFVYTECKQILTTMKKIFLFVTFSLFLASFAGANTPDRNVRHLGCKGVSVKKIKKQKNFYKNRVQKMHERSLERQRKTYNKALSTGDATFRY